MSMDPSKWINFEKLSEHARQRIETVYPYLKIEHCMFQEKDSGVFMKQGNSVKIEKLLDPPRKKAAAAAASAPADPEPAPKAAATARGKK